MRVGQAESAALCGQCHAQRLPDPMEKVWTFLDTGPMQRILEIIRSADFRAAVATLPGYVPSDTGTVTGVKAFLEMHAVR